MAKATRKKVSKIKTKKKTWFPVLAPKLFAQKQVGESYLSAAEEAKGRVFRVNARDLTGNIRDQNNNVKFRITGFNGHALMTESIGFAVNVSSVKRAVRKNTARLDDYFALPTQDGKIAVIKTVLVTRNRVQRSTRADLRNGLLDHLKIEIKKHPFPTFLGMAVESKIQMGAKKKLNKICPIKEVMIRVIELKDSVKNAKVESLDVEEQLTEKPVEEAEA